MPSLATEREWDYRVWADEVWKTCRGLDVEHAQDAYEYAIVKLNGGDSLRRELARRDLFYLLYYLLHREDMGHPWLYARVREVEVARDWHLDLWAREHRKLLRVDEPVPTPSGWTNHGDLKPGDMVFGPDGMPCQVIAKTQVWERPPECRITFDDGMSIIAGDEHLWEVERRTRKRIPMAYKASGPQRLYRERAIVSTLDIEAHDHRTDNRLSVRVNDALELPDVKLLIDPYVLGCWLGDGNRDSAAITMLEEDAVPLVSSLLSNGHSIKVLPTHSRARLFRIDTRDRGVVCARGHERTPENVYRNGCKKCRAQRQRNVKFGDDRDPLINGLAQRLRLLRLLADATGVKRGYHKHIPAQYLRASASQRLALLQGLMDTDGSCSTRGTAAFANTNRELVDGFLELAHSLGLKPLLRTHVSKYRGEPYTSFEVAFQAYKAMPPFRIERKLVRCKEGARPHPRRYIVSCERVDPTPGSCIQVDRPDGLYLAGRAMVTTHNSSIITFGCTTQDILASHGDNPLPEWGGIEPTFGIFSHTATNAQKFLVQIKAEFETNLKLQSLFPDILYENPEKDAAQ